MRPCFHCTQLFNNQREVRKHLNSLGFITCQRQECPAAFSSLQLLEEHYKVIHAEYIQLECAHCKRIFNDAATLSTHLIEENHGEPTVIRILSS